MTNFVKIVIFSFILFFQSSNINAGILVEPYLGYGFGSGESGNSGNTVDESYSSPVIGGRLGGTYLGLMAGLDYSIESFKLNSEIDATNQKYKDKMNKSQLGLFVGFKFPTLLRVWGTYYLTSQMKGQDAAAASGQLYSSNHEFKDGSGVGIGVSYTMLPLINLNFEFRSFQYDKETNQGQTVSTAVYSSKMKLNEYIFSVSLPLNFL